MKSECDIYFTNDIMLFLEDYNSIISQAVQAIRSLLSENARLIQNQTLSVLDNNTSNNIIHNMKIENDKELEKEINKELTGKEYQSNGEWYVKDRGTNRNEWNDLKERNNSSYEEGYKWFDKNDVKQPLRQQIKMMNKKKGSKYVKMDIEDSEMPLKLAALTRKTCDEEERKKENETEKDNEVNMNDEEEEEKENGQLKIMEKTNEIWKWIEITKQNEEMFVEKYIGSACAGDNDATQWYKEFIENIINYKYSLDTLDSIFEDISKIRQQRAGRTARINTRKSSIGKTGGDANIKQGENWDFKTSWRNYSPSCKSQQNRNMGKPFVQFTNPYSRWFSKEQSSNS